MVRLAVTIVILAWLHAGGIAAADDGHNQDLANLCRNPAFANMHEECYVRQHGGPGFPGTGSDDGGLLGIVTGILGGLL